MNKKVAQGILIGIIVAVGVGLIIHFVNKEKEDNLLDDFDDDDRISDDVKEAVTESLVHKSYKKVKISLEEAIKRVKQFKNLIENKDGYKILYGENKKPFRKETELQILFNFVWVDSEMSVDNQVNNGRGNSDVKVSQGLDQTLIELKLASNPKLKSNLLSQMDIYAAANNEPGKVFMIFYYSEKEKTKLDRDLAELNAPKEYHIFTIDARDDNKPSASRA